MTRSLILLGYIAVTYTQININSYRFCCLVFRSVIEEVANLPCFTLQSFQVVETRFIINWYIYYTDSMQINYERFITNATS